MEINQNKLKKQNLKDEMAGFIDEFLDAAESMGSLQYFDIEMKNHNGTLHVEGTLKDRKKVY